MCWLMLVAYFSSSCDDCLDFKLFIISSVSWADKDGKLMYFNNPMWPGILLLPSLLAVALNHAGCRYSLDMCILLIVGERLIYMRKEQLFHVDITLRIFFGLLV